VKPIAHLKPVSVDRSGLSSRALVTKRGITFSGYWRGPCCSTPGSR
jgi:hypothetical protein